MKGAPGTATGKRGKTHDLGLPFRDAKRVTDAMIGVQFQMRFEKKGQQMRFEVSSGKRKEFDEEIGVQGMPKELDLRRA